MMHFVDSSIMGFIYQGATLCYSERKNPSGIRNMTEGMKACLN